MSIFPKKWSTLDSSSEEQLSAGQLGYFRARLRNAIHEAVLGKFIHEYESNGLTKARLAKRLGKRPEQITRWLAAPGNWTLETVSDLLLAMNSELRVEAAPWAEQSARNYAHDLICKSELSYATPNDLTVDVEEGVTVLHSTKTHSATENKMVFDERPQATL